MVEFKTWRAYELFAEEVIRRNRYIFSPDTQEFLATVSATCGSRERSPRMDQYLWRASRGAKEILDDHGRLSYAPHSAERMKPQLFAASEGRVNVKGIPCLYTATRPDTAVSEIRPQIAERVTVASLFLAKELRIIDCGSEGGDVPSFEHEPTSVEREKAVWQQINRAFSQPLATVDGRAEYAPTQVLAELFRSKGYDGVAYQSGLGTKGYNVALFNPNSAIIAALWVYKVDGLRATVSRDMDAEMINPGNHPEGMSLEESFTRILTDPRGGFTPGSK